MKKKINSFKQWLPIRLLQRRLGFDLGSSKIRLWDSVSDHYIEEASCLAVDIKTKDVVAFGNEAAEMEGRSATNIKIIWPIKKGVITDEEASLLLMKMMLQKLIRGGLIFRPIILAGVPGSMSVADRQTMIHVLSRLGAREVNTISAPLAASIGAQVPIADATGCFLLHVGDQVTEAAAISLGRTVVSKSCFFGGVKLKKRLAAAIKKQFQIELSQEQLEEHLQKNLSLSQDHNKKIKLTGKSIKSGNTMEEVELVVSDLIEIIKPVIDEAADCLSLVLSQVPAELAGDAVNKGVLISGGVANLDGIDRYFSEKFKMPVFVVDQPDQMVIRGIKSVLNSWSDFKVSFGYES